MKRGFYVILAAQFFSALADNALLLAAIALLRDTRSPEWMTPLLKSFFVISYVVLAPFVGAFADALAKGRVMFISNAIKVAGCLLMLFSAHPLVAYAVVGLGAAAYSPAKYGILTEYLPASKLVVANGWMEGLTVAAIVFGNLLGGILISPKVASEILNFDFPIIDTGIDTAPEEALLIIVGVYALAALVNLYIPNTGVDHKPLKSNPLFLIHDFWHCFKLLWKDKLGQVSLAVTTLFWGAGATLNVLVLYWAESHMRMKLHEAPALLAISAIGVALGSVWAARKVSLADSTAVLPVGVGMGLAVMLMVVTPLVPLSFPFGSGTVNVPGWWTAIPLLILVGGMAGYFVVPMNALLQHRGHLLMGAGHSIAVQNFNENASILLMGAVYSGLTGAGVSQNVVIIGFGSFVSLTMWLVIRMHLANVRATRRPLAAAESPSGSH